MPSAITLPPDGTVLDWRNVFPKQHAEIWIEIGFGGGENLLCLANQYPDKCFVGSDVHNASVGKFCRIIHKALEKQQLWSGYKLFQDEDQNQEAKSHDCSEWGEICPDPYSNLRIYGGDGIKLLWQIPASSVEAILITFPDPFDYIAEQQWRILQIETLGLIYNVLKDGGRLALTNGS